MLFLYEYDISVTYKHYNQILGILIIFIINLFIIINNINKFIKKKKCYLHFKIIGISTYSLENF